MAKFELGKITKKIGSGFTPKGGKSTYCSKGIAFVRSQNILDMQFSKDGLVYISDKQAAKLKNASIESDDVLLNITGDSVARACIMDSKYLPARVNQHVSIIRCDPNKIKSQYLLYYLQYLKKHLLKMASVGSTRKALTKEEISGLLVELPSIEKQKEITLLLESVRHKMQINRQINDNLAAMIKTIYEYWFIQFEFPDENGKPYKSSGGKMVWNEQLKREIPDSWRTEKLLNIVSWESNSQPPKSEFIYSPKDGYVRFIQNRDYENDSYKTYIPLTNNLSTVNRFDILIDKYGDAGVVRYGIEGAFNVALGKINVLYPNCQEYVRSFLESDSIYSYLHNSCMASTRASLNESNLDMLNIVIPDENSLLRYQEDIHQIRETILLNNSENQNLISLRDWLLPMLMNGQATIED